MKIKYNATFNEYKKYFKTFHLFGNWYLMRNHTKKKKISWYGIVNKNQFPSYVENTIWI